MRGVVLLCAVLAASAMKAPTEMGISKVQEQTAELMSQILAAVSSGTGTHTDDSMIKLCAMVNQIEAAVIQMGSQEVSDYEYAMAHLRAELTQVKANLTAARLDLNNTLGALKRHETNMSPVPKQLDGAKAREDALSKQRDLLYKECEQDYQGQRLRTDAVKTDLSVLDEALKHLSSLKHLQVPSQSNIALIETSEITAEPACTDPTITGPLIRCQNGYYVPALESNGTLSTFPPGNGMAYTQKMKCGFKLVPANAGVLDRIELNFLALETVSDVDFVEVFDGPVPNPQNLIAKFSGHVTPLPKLRSKTPEMTVMFTMNGGSRQVSPGFVATYKAIRIPMLRSSAINMCAGTAGVPLVLTGSSGSVAEDSRPEFATAVQNSAGSAYRQPLTCSWLIQTDSAHSLRFHFTFMNTEEGSDFVTVRDGEDIHAPILLKHSGSSVPSDILSSGSALFVTYHADYAVEGFGFHATWCINSTTCPGPDAAPQLPPAVPLSPTPAPQYNASAPLPEVTSTPTPTPQLAPPEYPIPTPQVQSGSCCPLDCSNHGICNPSTCFCACYSGFSGHDCSTVVSPAVNMLIELDAGMDAENAISTNALLEDECGDNIEDVPSGVAVQQLNLDSVSSLLERLKFELFRSLTYEHDTTNITKQQCTKEVATIDADLQSLQQEVLMLGKVLADMTGQHEVLKEKRDSLSATVASYQSYANELVSRIEASRTTRETRSSSQQQELSTLQGMRDLITTMGGHECPRDFKGAVAFKETSGVQCFGELLDSDYHTSNPQDCRDMCLFGCVGFTFHSHEGCKFFSSIREHTPGCSGEATTCSCFEKA